MLVYFDTNIFVAGNYHLNTGKFNAVQNLIKSGRIEFLYTSATLGEIEKNLSQDIHEDVIQYNQAKNKIKVITKEGFVPIKLNEEQILGKMKSRIRSFFSQQGVTEIPLEQISTEELMNQYFNKIPPFEKQKPDEFKDAIMIHAIKCYQKRIQDSIIIVSGDSGFTSAFRGNTDFKCFSSLVDFLKYANESVLQNAVDYAIENGDANELLFSILESLSVFCDDYADFECDDFEIESFSAFSLYINIISETENKEKDEKYYTVTSDIFVTANVYSTLSYRNEEESYYDKEEERYLFEKYVIEERGDQVDVEIPLQFDIVLRNGSPVIKKISKCDVTPEPSIEIDGYTNYYSNILDEQGFSDDELEFCSECGRILGHQAPYLSYQDEPICHECMKDDRDRSLCPHCGKLYPNDMMISGFCESCSEILDE